MKIKKTILPLLITLSSTVLIISLGYNILAYAGASFLDANTEITPLSTDNSTTYVFYSQAEENVTLFPWGYYNEATPFKEYYRENTMISDILTINSIELIMDQLSYYFYRMTPIQTTKIDYEEFSLYHLLISELIEDNLKVQIVNYNTVFFYSKEISIGEQKYNLSFTFTDKCRILSFQIKTIYSTVVKDEDMNTSKKLLSEQLNSSQNNPIPFIYYDILLQNGYYSYSMDQDDYNMSERESLIGEEYYHTYGNKYEFNSYQLVDTDDEILIILTDNNVVLHFDPISNLITGFNLPE